MIRTKRIGIQDCFFKKNVVQYIKISERGLCVEILKIILFIILAIILILCALLLLPAKLVIYNNDVNTFNFAVKIFSFKVFDSSKKKAPKSKKNDKKPKTEKEEQKKGGSSFKNIKSTVNKLSVICRAVLNTLKKSRLESLKSDIIISSSNAAQAAIEYGACCAVVYPLVNFIESSVKSKRNASDINIKCDFDSIICSFDFELIISLKLFYAVTALLKLLSVKGD